MLKIRVKNDKPNGRTESKLFFFFCMISFSIVIVCFNVSLSNTPPLPLPSVILGPSLSPPRNARGPRNVTNETSSSLLIVRCMLLSRCRSRTKRCHRIVIVIVGVWVGFDDGPRYSRCKTTNERLTCLYTSSEYYPSDTPVSNNRGKCFFFFL